MTNADQNSNYISGKTGDWEIVIGLEIHAQVLSSSKLFLEHLLNLVKIQIIMFSSRCRDAWNVACN